MKRAGVRGIEYGDIFTAERFKIICTNSFKYLGTTVQSDAKLDKEINMRTAK